MQRHFWDYGLSSFLNDGTLDENKSNIYLFYGCGWIDIGWIDIMETDIHGEIYITHHQRWPPCRGTEITLVV